MPMTSAKLKENLICIGTQLKRLMVTHLAVGIIFASISGYGTYFYATYEDIATRLEESLDEYEEKRSQWIQVSAAILRESNPNLTTDSQLPSVKDVTLIQESATKLISELNAVPAPTSSIEEATQIFRERLSEVVREVGRYDSTPEAIARITQASQLASQAGALHRSAIENYLGSSFNRFLGAV